ESNLRLSPFMQHWKPKMQGLQEDLKAMLKVAAKYGLRMEGLAIERSILRALPMWDAVKADPKELRRLAGKSRVVRCLAVNHEAKTVGDFERIASVLEDVGHGKKSACVCKGCERMIAEERCASPGACAARAKAFLDLLPARWDPRGDHLEDQVKDAPEELEGRDDGKRKFDKHIITRGSTADVFRIFTDERESVCPESEERILTANSGGQERMIIATDGSCFRNGEEGAVAGAGIYIQGREEDSVAVRLPAEWNQTNQTGEIAAVLWAATNLD
ncbi:hypothetical protein FKP32DRAFT_1541828, partial [Trametes sanguinea]